MGKAERTDCKHSYRPDEWLPPIESRSAKRIVVTQAVLESVRIIHRPGTVPAQYDVESHKYIKRRLLSPVDIGMARLERAARAANEASFFAALKLTSWEKRPASDFISGVQLALQAGAHLAARHLSSEGARLYPENIELQKQARILAPARVVARTPTTYPAHRANRDWLKANESEYRDRWVALRDGQLLGTATSSEELLDQVGKNKDVLLTVV